MYSALPTSEPDIDEEADAPSAEPDFDFFLRCDAAASVAFSGGGEVGSGGGRGVAGCVGSTRPDAPPRPFGLFQLALAAATVLALASAGTLTASMSTLRHRGLLSRSPGNATSSPDGDDDEEAPGFSEAIAASNSVVSLAAAGLSPVDSNGASLPSSEGVSAEASNAVAGADAAASGALGGGAGAAASDARALKSRWRAGAPPASRVLPSAQEPEGPRLPPAEAVDPRGSAITHGAPIPPGARWDLVQDPNRTIFSRRQRAGGWQLDREKSSMDTLVWKKQESTGYVWYREKYDFYAEKDSALDAVKLTTDHTDPCDELEIECIDGHIVKVDLSYSEKANGIDLAGFADLKFLRVLDLSHTEVKGDIAALARLFSLEELDLRESKVSGDLESLGSLRSLRCLRLGGSQTQGDVRGDIRGLRQLVSLKELDLSVFPNVRGDLGALSVLRNLEVLRLGETQVSGDVAALAQLPRLRHVGLAFTLVVGELASLKPLAASLEHLNLRGTSRTVEVEYPKLVPVPEPFDAKEFARRFGASLSWEPPALDEVSTGENRGLAGLGWQAKDRLLEVNGEPVHEHAEVLRALARVTENALPFVISLERGIFGDIGSLSDFHSLRWLSLGGSGTSGDMAKLAELDRLEHLELFDTKVRGNARALLSLRSLVYLNLMDTLVPCPLGCRMFESDAAIKAAIHRGSLQIEA